MVKSYLFFTFTAMASANNYHDYDVSKGYFNFLSLTPPYDTYCGAMFIDPLVLVC